MGALGYDRQMKIAFLVTEFPALSETFILNQITGLLDRGHDVDIFAIKRPDTDKVHPDVKKYDLMERVHYIFDEKAFYNKLTRVLKAFLLVAGNIYKTPFTILRSLNVLRYGMAALSLTLLYAAVCFQNRKFDIIHAHFGPNGIIATFLKEIRVSTKVITTFHGYDMSSFISERGSGVYRRFFHNCDLCLPISVFWKAKLIELGCDERKIAVHRMGVDTGRFRCIERKLYPSEPVRILSVGRLIEKKGHWYALKAFSRVAAKHKNVSYIIAGDGPLRSSLQSLVDELKLHDHVNFPGEVDQNEVLQLYERAHILIQPSITAKTGEQEGIPVVLMEAQASGLPVIATYHSGIPEVVIDNKNGFLVPEEDEAALAEKLEYLVTHPEARSAMGRAGREMIENRHDIRKLNEQLVQIYERLVHSNPRV